MFSYRFVVERRASEGHRVASRHGRQEERPTMKRRVCPWHAVCILALAAMLSAVSSRVALGETQKSIVQVGDLTATAEQIKAEFASGPPSVVQAAKRDDNSARVVAIDWYSTALIAKAAQDDGYLAKDPGLASFADSTKRKIIAKTTLEQYLAKQTQPTQAEIDQFKKLNPELCLREAQFRLAVIGVTVGRHASDAERRGAEERVAAIRKRIDSGEDFGTVADSASDLPAKSAGGDVGWVTMSDLPRFGEAATLSALQIGSVGPTSTTPNGFAIVKMLEREEAGGIAAGECKRRVEQAFAEQYRKQVVRQWIDELAKRYNSSLDIDAFIAAVRSVELDPDWLEKAAEPTQLH